MALDPSLPLWEEILCTASDARCHFSADPEVSSRAKLNPPDGRAIREGRVVEPW